MTRARCTGGRVVLVALVMFAGQVTGCVKKRGPTQPPHITNVLVSMPTDSIGVGDTVTAMAYARTAESLWYMNNPPPFTWSVADSSIIQLRQTSSNRKVQVTGVRQGRTTIYATCQGVRGVANITVAP